MSLSGPSNLSIVSRDFPLWVNISPSPRLNIEFRPRLLSFSDVYLNNRDNGHQYRAIILYVRTEMNKIIILFSTQYGSPLSCYKNLILTTTKFTVKNGINQLIDLWMITWQGLKTVFAWFYLLYILKVKEST